MRCARSSLQPLPPEMIKPQSQLALVVMTCLCLGAVGGAPQSKLVFAGREGKLSYKPDENGNTIPDFSNCGYMGGGVELPDVAVKATIGPVADSKDDTDRIQKAIDQVCKSPADGKGMRGALLLKRGSYRLGGQLHGSAGGV